MMTKHRRSKGPTQHLRRQKRTRTLVRNPYPAPKTLSPLQSNLPRTTPLPHVMHEGEVLRGRPHPEGASEDTCQRSRSP
ncbi:hypothetical protein Slala05_75570 [Streptomyces lavendulae subsp. lavendulae]|nr:hypothetical protein Slala05_75570 [Streptomyces lavendulae subsp. lavendulae]